MGKFLLELEFFEASLGKWTAPRAPSIKIVLAVWTNITIKIKEKEKRAWGGGWIEVYKSSSDLTKTVLHSWEKVVLSIKISAHTSVCH